MQSYGTMNMAIKLGFREESQPSFGSGSGSGYCSRALPEVLRPDLELEDGTSVAGLREEAAPVTREPGQRGVGCGGCQSREETVW